VSYLLDTNIVSELRKRTANPGVTGWFNATPSADLFLSALTIGEIRLGVERLRRKDEVQALVIEQWLTGLRTIYRDHIVPVDSEIADRWGRLNVPEQLPVIDGLLAATALVRDWTLVTRNTGDFARSGVRLLNPREDGAR
jgi:predicted nucleic acid-binding protein